MRKRNEIIASQINRDISNILKFDVYDERLHNTIITEVIVTPNLQLAKIYWISHNISDNTTITKLLNKAAGFIRKKLSNKFSSYSIPQLYFIYDSSVDKSNSVFQLLSNISKVAK